MSYAQAQSALDALPPEADKLAHATATVYQWNPSYYVTYRALIALVGKEKTDAIRAFVKLADATGLYDALLLQSGQEGGAQLMHEEVQGLLTMAAANGIITGADALKINNEGRTALGPRYQAEWQLQAFDANTLARLPLLVKHEALAADVDRTLAAIDTYPDIVSTAAGFEVTPTHRSTLVAYVQNFAALINADDPAAEAFDATLAAAWAFATQEND